MYCWFSFSAILFLFNMSVFFSFIVPTIVCVCVCVCVYKRGSFRSGLQSEGSKYSVWFGSGEWGGSIGWGWWSKFSVLSRKKNNYTLIIPLSDWTIIYFASMLANSVISSIFALRSSCTLNPCFQHPCLCVWSVYTRYIIKYIFDVPLNTWFTVFIICGLL